jgi:transcriptional regulator with XRE-family HTH domain
MIADGTLMPGAPVPSGAALARKTGYSVGTCRAALRSLLAAGTLARGASTNARLRVATAPGAGGALRPSLSSALAARRRAGGLTQPQLAALLGVSVTTVGHAETGRLWQSRKFWQQADRVLGAAGALLSMYDEHQAADDQAAAEESPEPAPPPLLLPLRVTITPAGVVVVWPDGTESVARPPGCQDQPAAVPGAGEGADELLMASRVSELFRLDPKTLRQWTDLWFCLRVLTAVACGL